MEKYINAINYYKRQLEELKPEDIERNYTLNYAILAVERVAVEDKTITLKEFQEIRKLVHECFNIHKA